MFFSLEILVSYLLSNLLNRRLDVVKAIMRGLVDGIIGFKTLASREELKYKG